MNPLALLGLFLAGAVAAWFAARRILRGRSHPPAP